MAGAVNTIGQSKRGGGDRSSRPAQLQARENEQKALSLWIKGATFQQIAAAAVTEPVRHFLGAVIVSGTLHVYVSPTDLGELGFGASVAPFPSPRSGWCAVGLCT